MQMMDSDDDFDYTIYSQYEVVSNQTKDTISKDTQTRFPVQFAFAKFPRKIKGNF